MRTTKVKVNLLNPGPMRTSMRAKAMPGEDPKTLPPPEALVPLIVDLLSPSCTKNGDRGLQGNLRISFRRSLCLA